MVQQPNTAARHSRISRRPARLFGWRNAAFFVAVPSVFAAYAASGNRILEVLPPLQVLLYNLTHALIAWWVICAVTRGVQELLQRWRPHQIIILTLGVFLMSWVYPPITGILDQAFLDLWTTPENRQHLIAVLGPARPEASFLPFSFGDYVIWVAVNLLFDRFAGLPRYRYAEPDAQTREEPAEEPVPQSSTEGAGLAIAQETMHPPVFLQRLEEPPDLVDIIAMKAEQHYIKIYTRNKKYILLYRFGDALAELPENLGWQVHRSWWIRNGVLRCLHQSGRKMHAELVTGDRVPVSSPNQAVARKMAADANLEIKPIENNSPVA